MKKLKKVTLEKVTNVIVGVGIISFFIALVGILGTYENSYKLKGEIIYNNNGEIGILDCADEIWIIEDDNENYIVGTEVVMTMFNNGTEDFLDDEVLSVKIAK